MEIHSFEENEISKLHVAFSKAFSDYKVQMNLSEEDFRIRMLNKLNINHPLSGLACENGNIIGFMLHTRNKYQGIDTIYNGGTGVIRAERNKGIAQKIYESLIPVIKSRGARRIILEVIISNKKAIRLYEKLGFEFKQTFKCFKGIPDKKYSNNKLVVAEAAIWTPNKYALFKDFEPSFIDSNEQVPFNFKNETLLEAYLELDLVGFILFQKRIGRITQFGVSQKARNQGVASSLFRACYDMCNKKELSILNVPETGIQTINFFESIGLKHQLDQYEMEILI